MNFLSRQTPQKFDPEQQDGVYLAEDDQSRLSRKRSQRELARAQVSANIAWGLAAASMLVAVVAGFGWHAADARLANNVQVAWVKLEPGGPSQVEIDPSNGDQNRWYESGINASLINYVEHRFRKRRQTISADYGFSLLFLGNSERSAFLDRYNAAKVAADFEHCSGGCEESDIEIRAIDHDQLISPARAKDRVSVVESTVYLTVRPLATGGKSTAGQRLRFIKILWQLKPIGELNKDLNALKANPLGIEILEQHEFDDLAK
jgi:hypothetical protein